jgi:hypothetical protein
MLWKRNYKKGCQKLGMMEKGMMEDAHPTYFVNLFLLFLPPATFSHVPQWFLHLSKHKKSTI